MLAVPAALHDHNGPALPLFPTRPGGRLNPSNIRNRLLHGTPPRNGKPAIKTTLKQKKKLENAALDAVARVYSESSVPSPCPTLGRVLPPLAMPPADRWLS